MYVEGKMGRRVKGSKGVLAFVFVILVNVDLITLVIEIKWVL